GLCIYYPEHMARYLTHYNTIRPHMGIQYKTPHEMLR
ncbi:MAG: transposase, partial [Candidatus Niyogibacteria bacterium]|nr:transposase [Candidatus Niyogibacteria bacterium]MBI5045514.1 transposase [Candidatus Niyogibacteria bacterium]